MEARKENAWRALVLEEFGGPFILKEVATPGSMHTKPWYGCATLGCVARTSRYVQAEWGFKVLPLIIGHEVAGEVAEVGSEVWGIAAGDRVTLNFY